MKIFRLKREGVGKADILIIYRKRFVDEEGRGDNYRSGLGKMILSNTVAINLDEKNGILQRRAMRFYDEADGKWAKEKQQILKFIGPFLEDEAVPAVSPTHEP